MKIRVIYIAIFLIIFLFQESCNKTKPKRQVVVIDSLSFVYLDTIKNKKIYQEKLDFYYESIKSSKSDKEKIKFYPAIINRYYDLNDAEKLKLTIDEFSKIALKENNPSLIAKSYRFKGGYYKFINKIDSSFYFYRQSERKYSELGDKKNYAEVLLKKSYLQMSVNDFLGADLSLSNAYIFNKYLDDYQKVYILNQRGIIAYELRYFSKSKQLFDEAIEIIKQKNIETDERLISACYSNIGVSFIRDNKFRQAMPYINKALDDKLIKEKNPSLYSNALLNLGICKLEIGDIKGVEKTFLQTLKIKDSLKDNIGVVSSYINLSKYYKKTNNAKKALFYANKALSLAKKENGAINTINALQQASEVDSKNALKYSEEYISISDSLQLLERKSKDLFARIQLETEVIKQENSKLTSEKDFFLNILFGIAVTGSLIVMLMLQQAKNKKLQLIKVQHDADERIYQALLEEQQKLDEARIEERKRIAREIHDDILGRLFGLRLSLDSNHTETEITYSENLQNIEKDLRKISHELYDKDHLINNFEASISTFIKDQEKQLKIPVKLSIDKKIIWQKFSNIALINVYRIIQESYYNIAKYAEATQITTSFIKDENNLVVEITDNGKGFNVAKTRKGIGISNMYDRIKESKGTIDIISFPNQGTQILITIPKETE